ncbi:MAG: hypothetical protein BWX64_02855 [Acidobacteria bacterium ADurb.Bin051]|nr:MAG: hypothetical protein BWX64_02855 [Acidobacteria bacterium ADurb.Bin051]
MADLEVRPPHRRRRLGAVPAHDQRVDLRILALVVR